MRICSWLAILVTAGCAGAPLIGPSSNPYYSKAYEAGARASGFFFISPPVTPRPDGSLAVFIASTARSRNSPRLSQDMLRALTRLTGEIRPKYREDLRIAFPFVPGGRQFFAVFLRQDSQSHILNLCHNEPSWNCKHRCSSEIDLVNHVLTIMTFRDASCMDSTPYWRA